MQMQMIQQAESAMKEGLPKISVCTISFNHAHCIRDCINGVRTQKYGGEVQHVISDDKSTDQTAKVIEESIREKSSVTYKIINQPENVGMNQNLIDALSACDGEFIALCEGDDYWVHPAKLSRQVSQLMKNTEIAMATHECYRIYYPPKKFRSLRRAAKMVYWDTKTYGLAGFFELLKARIRGRERFWAKDRCRLEADRKDIYQLADLLNGVWIQPFCSILMRKKIVEPFIESLRLSEGGHQLALLLGGVFGGINHDRRPMAVKRDQKSSVTLDEARKARSLKRNANIETNNYLKRYRSILKYADSHQSDMIEQRIERYLNSFQMGRKR